MTYSVKISQDALHDMEDIYNYIAEELQAPENALGQYNRIADSILTLEEFPERFRLVLFEPERSMGLHQMLVDNYSVFYLIESDSVCVTNVLYNAVNLEERLNRK